jgi:hypothetical protein
MNDRQKKICKNWNVHLFNPIKMNVASGLLRSANEYKTKGSWAIDMEACRQTAIRWNLLDFFEALCD